MKRVLVSVINDLVTDQRVHRTCSLLVEEGFEVELVGRVQKNSLELKTRIYKCTRMKLFFEKGALFYTEFNIRLFLLLLSRKKALLFSNDLDTLLPNYLVSKLKRQKLVYDAHEYFTEVPELEGRRFVKKIWSAIEGFVLKRMESIITVNDSIAKLYYDKYGLEVKVVRNVPFSFKSQAARKKENLLILQGAGINIDRGGEELVQAMQWIQGELWIVGSGDALPILKSLVEELGLKEKVLFKGKVSLDELKNLTLQAEIGFTLDKPTNINYLYSLPNKLFDYLQASCAVISSNLPELKRIIEEHEVGDIISEVVPQIIAEKVNALLSDRERLHLYQKNALKAAEKLNWENEKLKLKLYLESKI